MTSAETVAPSATRALMRFSISTSCSGEIARAFVEGRYENDFAGNWHLLTRAYFDHYTYEGTFVYDYMDPANPGLVVNHDTPLAQWCR